LPGRAEDLLGELLARVEGRAIYPRVIVALFTGMRRGELLALRWIYVDLEPKGGQNLRSTRGN